MKLVLLVALGGALGSVSRYKLAGVITHHSVTSAFPYGTFAVNVLGCLVAGLLIGVDDSLPRTSTSIDLPPDATLVAYTDGLIERPGADLDDGIGELVGRLSGARPGAGPRELCDAAVAGSLDGRDDVALIAVRFC